MAGDALTLPARLVPGAVQHTVGILIRCEAAAPSGKADLLPVISQGARQRDRGDIAAAAPIGSVLKRSTQTVEQDISRLRVDPFGKQIGISVRREGVIQRHQIAGGIRPCDLRVPKPGEYIFREVIIRRIVVDQVGKGRAAVPAAVPHQSKSVPVDRNGVVTAVRVRRGVRVVIPRLIRRRAELNRFCIRAGGIFAAV